MFSIYYNLLNINHSFPLYMSLMYFSPDYEHMNLN